MNNELEILKGRVYKIQANRFSSATNRVMVRLLKSKANKPVETQN